MVTGWPVNRCYAKFLTVNFAQHVAGNRSSAKPAGD